MGLLSPLSEEEQTTFLVVSLPDTVLRKLVGRLGTAPKGTRLDALSVWELADTLVDYYATDAEVTAEVDRTVRRELDPSPLVPALDAEGGAATVTALVLDSRDPARDLAWGLLGAAREEDRALASRLVQTIIADFDQADERAKEQKPKSESQVVRETERLARKAEKEAQRAESQRERALQRVDDLRARLVELEQGIAAAKKSLRESERARDRAVAERDKLAKDREALKARLQSGTAAEVVRLTEELEAAERQTRALESEVDETRSERERLAGRVRELEQAGAARPAAAEPVAGPEPSPGAVWCTPIFTDEFYDSIRRWDRRIVRGTFEKVARLCEDWRHPSLRAIALEGLPGYHRIRIATDVRLIYRPIDGNRIEILSLIDREDLQRYIRSVKGS